jgi:hypothetical protein
MMLLLSVIFGLLPLAGVAFIVKEGSLTSIDGLFTSLILLTLSGILFFNIALNFLKPHKSKKAK